jgi:MFS family permease
MGGPTKIAWVPVSNTLALAAVAPFCGYMQDIFGKRNITLGGAAAIMIGIVLLATSHTFGQSVAAMSLAGAGAAIGELSALAG